MGNKRYSGYVVEKGTVVLIGVHNSYAAMVDIIKEENGSLTMEEKA